jgi:hypothetical protein
VAQGSRQRLSAAEAARLFAELQTELGEGEARRLSLSWTIEEGP